MSDRSEGFIPCMVSPRLIEIARCRLLDEFGYLPVSLAVQKAEIDAIEIPFKLDYASAATDAARRDVVTYAIGAYNSLVDGRLDAIRSQWDGLISLWVSGGMLTGLDPDDLAKGLKILNQCREFYAALIRFQNSIGVFIDTSEFLRPMRGAEFP